MSHLTIISWHYEVGLYKPKIRYKSKIHILGPSSTMLNETTLCGTKVEPDANKKGTFVYELGGSLLSVNCGRCKSVNGVRTKLKLYKTYVEAPYGDEI